MPMLVIIDTHTGRMVPLVEAFRLWPVALRKTGPAIERGNRNAPDRSGRPIPATTGR
jgi:hypothetical protein